MQENPSELVILSQVHFPTPCLVLLHLTQLKMMSFLTLFFSFIFGHQQPQIEAEPSSPADICMIRGPYMYREPNTRTEFWGRSCRTTAYPSSGGIVLGDFSAVEVAHLNLSRIEPADRSSDPAEEDDLAQRMLRLGAHWWPSLRMYSFHQEQIDDGEPYDFHFPPKVKVGYPSSGEGVWVVKFSADRRTFDPQDERNPYLERVPDDWYRRISMVLTMDERCEALKDFGATFYEKVEDCEDIAKTLQEGVLEGKRYEELLKKMEDMKYVEEWLNPLGYGNGGR